VLFATRDIKPLELILIDPGTVVGPNYKSLPVCLSSEWDAQEKGEDQRGVVF